MKTIRKSFVILVYSILILILNSSADVQPYEELCDVQFVCPEERGVDGLTVTLIPKEVPAPPVGTIEYIGKMRYFVCRRPDCLSNPCANGRCEETKTSYKCHCPPEYTGQRCDEPICPQGWQYGTNKCYTRMTNATSWQQSRSHCESLSPVKLGGGELRQSSLFFIESEEELTNFVGLVEFNDTRSVWINCNNIESEGTFMCEADAMGTLSGYRNWKSGQPNNYNNQDCVCMWVAKTHLSDKVGMWQDVSCGINYWYVCQVKLT